MKLTIPCPPSANDYWSFAKTKSGRLFQYVTTDAKRYKREVQLCNPHEPISGNVKIVATVYRRRKVGDLDNFAKVLCDALKGVAYHDDKQIVEAHWYRKDDAANPRVEIEIEVIDGTRELF